MMICYRGEIVLPLYLQLMKGGNKMARPIRETSILFGEDARRFEEKMKRPRKVSKEERERRRKNYELVMKAATNFK